MADSIKGILASIKKFCEDRDWAQFHDPKSMAASISIEAAELLEHFQWKSRKEAEEYVITHKQEISEEVADVAMYLFEFADNLGIDLLEAMNKKIEKNATKYPVEKSKGSHLKYDQLA